MPWGSRVPRARLVGICLLVTTSTRSKTTLVCRSSGVDHVTSSPFNRHFHYFLKNTRWKLRAPAVAYMSPAFSEGPQAEATFQHAANCPHQSYNCTSPRQPVFYNDTVYILTRTSNRPVFFQACRASVAAQTQRNIVHLVAADNVDSLSYATQPGVTARLVPPVRVPFDAREPCDKCGASPLRGCGNAPPLTQPQARMDFLACYCNTSFPMNSYFDYLHAHVDRGWVMYLDDDNLLADRYAVSRALARATSYNDLLLWRSRLGRITPSNQGFGRVVMGDIDASNFMFHSSWLNLTQWHVPKRCGDFRTAVSLTSTLRAIWLNDTIVMAHPLRAKLGGLGLRQDAPSAAADR